MALAIIGTGYYSTGTLSTDGSLVCIIIPMSRGLLYATSENPTTCNTHDPKLSANGSHKQTAYENTLTRKIIRGMCPCSMNNQYRGQSVSEFWNFAYVLRTSFDIFC